MTALLFPVVPDFKGDYWRVAQIPATTTTANGVRVDLDLLHRVQRARLVLDLSASVTAVPAGGGDR